MLETADYLASSELAKAGYEYIVIDDGWTEQERDETGRIVPNKEKFPLDKLAQAEVRRRALLSQTRYDCAEPPLISTVASSVGMI